MSPEQLVELRRWIDREDVDLRDRARRIDLDSDLDLRPEAAAGQRPRRHQLVAAKGNRAGGDLARRRLGGSGRDSREHEAAQRSGAGRGHAGPPPGADVGEEAAAQSPETGH